MAKRSVAADANPLIGLAVAGGFDLLRGLFGTITVTIAVRDEVLAGGDLPGARELQTAMRLGWIKVARRPAGAKDYPELGAGEASTLALAKKRGPGCLVLMDDSLGRARARSMGITMTGLAGVLKAARRAGLVESIRPFFERLADAGFRISSETVRAVLEEAAEA